MAYDISDVELHQWAESSGFANASVVHYIVGPRGKVGFVRDLMIEITTSMVGTSTVPEIQVGISSGDYTYGRYRLGTNISTGYNTGPYRASAEAITGNPPRTLADYAGHVVLDGGPLTSKGIAGGSYGTQVPAGRIPASGWIINNVVEGYNGASTVNSSYSRIFVNGSQPLKDLVTGNLVSIQGVVGSTSVNANSQAITSIDTVNYQWFEVNQSWSTAYTSGGIVWLNVVVTLLAGTGTHATGGGIPRVKVQWIGPETV
jgi:hypothetical protein